MKVKNERGPTIAIRIFGNPPNCRIFAELTESELKFLQQWRQEIANAPKLAAARKALKEAKRQFAEIQRENEQRGKNAPR